MSEKKRSECIFGNLLQNLGVSDETVYSFLNIFAAKWCKRFAPHPNNVSLSTPPCEAWNAHHTGATTALSEKETPEFIPPQLWPQIRQIWIQLITACGVYCKRRCTKYALIWTNWSSDWERSGPSWITSSLQQPFVNGVVDSFRSVMRVSYTFSCNIAHTMLLTGFKSGEFGGHSWDRVSFCNNSMVARSQWAFQFSQGSVRGGIFRWGGKCLNHFEANLFRKLSIKYRQNRRV